MRILKEMPIVRRTNLSHQLHFDTSVFNFLFLAEFQEHLSFDSLVAKIQRNFL